MLLTTLCINGRPPQTFPTPPLTPQVHPAPASQPSQRIALHQLPDLCSGQYDLTWEREKNT